MDTAARRVRVVALLFAMFAVGWAAVISRDPSALASEMWPAGLAAAAVFSARGRGVPLVVALVGVLGFLTFLLGGRPLLLSVGGGLAVAVEAFLLAAILTDRGRITPRLMDDEQDTTRLFGAVAVAGLAAAAVTAAFLGTADPTELGLVALGTFVGHTSSAVVLLPFFLQTSEHGALAGRFERVAQWTMTVGLTVAVFLPDHFTALLFLVLPVLAWGARRLSLAETQWQLLGVATIGTFLTVFGFGPLAEAPDAYALPEITSGILLQTFLLCCGLTVVPIAVVVGHQLRDARQVRLERDRARAIVQSANVAIITTDEIGRITSFNPAAERLLGYREEEVLGEFTTMLHTARAVTDKAADLGVPDEFVHVALEMARPENASAEMRFVLKDGTERTHSMTLSRVVDDRGRVTGYVSTSEDVTEQVVARRALEEALATERRAVERLTEVDQVKDSFVSAVSHELRTPITSIVGYLEMLLDGAFGELGPEQRDAVSRIDANSRRLLSLIDELLTLSRVQDDGLGLVDRELDLRAVLRTAYDVVAPAWSGRALAVELRLPEQPARFTGDEDMLERVVVNLLGNAVKFTPDGGRVDVRLDVADDCFELVVSDTGIGIPDDEQELLFTRFFRSSNAQARAIPGSGLGLSIAKAIVEMHGGEVTVTSVAGEGTTFLVRLPKRLLTDL